jgi:hypothetical protein
MKGWLHWPYLRVAAVLAVACVGEPATAQTAPSAPKNEVPKEATTPAAPKEAAAQPAQASAESPLDQFAWLRGCWAGKVERREFIESWLPARGGMMVGVGQTITQEQKQPGVQKTSDFQYLRLEARADGVYYVAIESGTKETAFKFTSVSEQLGRKAYTFANPVDAFPQRIVYLRGSEGWLYAQVAGTVDNNPKQVTYPMRHVDCLTGAPLSE